jgi:hypothetical protein
MTIRTINLYRVKAALAFVAEDCRFGLRRADDWRKDAKAVGEGLLPVTVAVDNSPYSLDLDELDV